MGVLGSNNIRHKTNVGIEITEMEIVFFKKLAFKFNFRRAWHLKRAT